MSLKTKPNELSSKGFFFLYIVFIVVFKDVQGYCYKLHLINIIRKHVRACGKHASV